MDEKFVSSNTLLPVMGILQQYLDKKVKKKKFNEYTESFRSKFENIQNPIDLETASQEMINSIYADEYLEPQDQAVLLQIGNTYRNSQEKKILQSNKEKLAGSSLSMLSQAAGGADLYYNGKLTKGKDILNDIQTLMGENANKEDVLKLYESAIKLGTTKNKSVVEFDPKTKQAQANTYKVTPFGLEIPSGIKTINPKDLSNLISDEYDQYAKYKFKVNMDEFNNAQSVNMALLRDDLMRDRTIKRELNRLEKGKDLRVIDPDNSNRTIPAKMYPFLDPNLTPEENYDLIAKGKGTFEVKDLHGNVIEDPVVRITEDKMTNAEKTLYRNTLASYITTWHENAKSNKFLGIGRGESPLHEYIFDKSNYSSTFKTVFEKTYDPYGDKTIERTLSSFLSPEIIDDITSKYRELKAENLTNDSDDALFNTLNRTTTSRIGDDFILKKPNELSDDKKNKFLEEWRRRSGQR